MPKLQPTGNGNSVTRCLLLLLRSQLGSKILWPHSRFHPNFYVQLVRKSLTTRSKPRMDLPTNDEISRDGSRYGNLLHPLALSFKILHFVVMVRWSTLSRNGLMEKQSSSSTLHLEADYEYLCASAIQRSWYALSRQQ